MADFFYSPEARCDLLEIWEYIAQDNLDEADRVEREIEAAITKLAKNPELGHLRRDLTSRHDSKTQPLEVVRILSGYRDVAQLLR